jgi:chorismate mutase
MLRAVRGAVQVGRDRPDLIHQATQELVLTLMEWNGLTPGDLVSLIFTVTPDLRSAFPAAAVRACGLWDVPMMCATEIPVPQALPRVIRLLAHVETDRDRSQLRHPYLGGAASLRPDLAVPVE